MKAKKIICFLIIFSICFSFHSNIAKAGVLEKIKKLKTSNKETTPQFIGGIGFSAGSLSGIGLSYKDFLSKNKSLQFTGGISGNSSDTISYNLSTSYHKLLDERKDIRLLLAPSFSLKQKIDLDDDKNTNKNKFKLGLGVSYGIEFKYSNVGIGLFTGLGVKISWKDTDNDLTLEKEYNFGPTANLSVLYYF